MKKRSPDKSHTAKLVRLQSIDVNFKVYLDGKWIYKSSDFAPVGLEFREQLVWDKTGKDLILEVGGRRIFGYSVSERRELTDKELLAVDFPAFEELRYEGKLPGAGK